MLKGKLIHPDIMAALALCGHGDKVLIADGNYPLDSKTGQAETVYLGLTPGLPTVTDVLAAIDLHTGERHVFDLTVKCTEQTSICVLRSFFDMQV